jgi:hypothetical protein
MTAWEAYTRPRSDNKHPKRRGVLKNALRRSINDVSVNERDHINLF